MTEKEIWLKNLFLGTEFDKYVLEHPEIEKHIPRGAIVVLMPEDNPELAQINRKIAEENREPGQPIVYVSIGRLTQVKSRISNVKLKLAV